MDASALPTCPACQQSNQVQKVTSTYGMNTKEWYETVTTTDANGNTHSRQELREAHTKLGLKLKPPAHPPQPTHPGLWYGIGGLIAFILASTLCPIALIPLGFIIPLIGASSFVPDVSGIPAWVITTLVIGLPILCIAILGLAGVIWLGSKIKQRFDRDMKSYKDKKALYDRDDRPRWQRAKNRWEQLYYCMRDETIFIPAENKAIKADDMEKYLYDPLFRG
ncbi:MAG: hypothetical protein Q8L87_02460 [Anaerolineales bacterium]|nr:hypothetical protein [Anaerolineales bacterium]